VTKSITATSSRPAGDSETVVLAVHRGGVSSRVLSALDAALSRVTELAGNSLEDPNLRILPATVRSRPSLHALAAPRKPTIFSTRALRRHARRPIQG
jgi:hypothetical protein